MTANYWLKLWLDILDDPKVAKWPDWLFRRFILFLCIAKENDKDGYLPPVKDLAWRSRLTDSQVGDALQALSEVGVVREDAQGWIIINFAKRQEATPAAERMRRLRKRRPVTKRNTEQNRTESEQIREREGAGGLFDVLPQITGIPATANDVETVERMEKAGVTPDDCRAALEWYKDQKKVLFSIRGIEGAAMYQLKKRVQSASAKPRKNGNGKQESIFDRERRRIAAEKEAMNGNRQ